MAYLKTHYYGGIKKYQWTSMPLALHGTIMTKEGKVDIAIGEDDTDPVLFITDILPHLAKDQYAKKIGEAIGGEDLNVLIGSMPYGDKDTKEKFKLNVLRLLNEKYNVTEADLVTAELEIVPAGKARCVGLDRGMVAAYGQDDRVCAYSSLRAILEIENPKKTAVGMFMDKEEVGSQGNTGSESSFFNDIVAELINLQMGSYSELYMRRAMGNTKVLSADVGAAYDPHFAGAYEKLNSGYAGKGLQIVKYTGARGKGGCNDANAEFVSYVRNIFDENDVIWQTGELGKVDQGGGGTIAYILANQNAEVIDCGVPVLCMHGPYEVTSKADIYMAYKGYKAFYKY
jgi:aspartyl aminopeptidase